MVCQTDKYIALCVSLELIFTIQTLYILNSIKRVKLCAYTDPFLLLSCRAINCSTPLVNPWNTTWGEMVSVFSGSTLALGKLVCKQRHASKISSYSKSEEWLFFFLSYPLCMETLPTTIKGNTIQKQNKIKSLCNHVYNA